MLTEDVNGQKSTSVKDFQIVNGGVWSAFHTFKKFEGQIFGRSNEQVIKG
jgi:hypothetical protein